MKICVLTHAFPRNKTDTSAAFMKEFCDGLVRAGSEVIVLAPYDKKFHRLGDPFKIVTYQYVWPKSLHVLGYSRTMEKDVKLRKRAYLLLPLMLFFGFWALYRVVKKEKIDLINVHWILPNGVIAAAVSFLTGVPYVVTLPGTDVFLASHYRLFGLVARLVGQRSAGITSNSSWYLDKIAEIGVANKPTALISYPVDVNRFKPSRRGILEIKKKLGLAEDELVILAVGRLVYKKGFEYLIKALPQVAAKFPRLKLIIAGEGDLKKELIKLALDLKIRDKVIFAGDVPRDKIGCYYNLAEVMVAPSVIDQRGNMDGGPVTSFEGMACGVAQIATDILGVADFIQNGVNGYKVPQKNPRAIAESLISLLGLRSLREKMGRANRILAVKSLSTRNIGGIYQNFFRNVVIKNNEKFK